jgi:hypothetical protein
MNYPSNSYGYESSYKSMSYPPYGSYENPYSSMAYPSYGSYENQYSSMSYPSYGSHGSYGERYRMPYSYIEGERVIPKFPVEPFPILPNYHTSYSSYPDDGYRAYGSGYPDIGYHSQSYGSGYPDMGYHSQSYGSGYPDMGYHSQSYGSGYADMDYKPQSYGSGYPDMGYGSGYSGGSQSYGALPPNIYDEYSSTHNPYASMSPISNYHLKHGHSNRKEYGYDGTFNLILNL